MSSHCVPFEVQLNKSKRSLRDILYSSRFDMNSIVGGKFGENQNQNHMSEQFTTLVNWYELAAVMQKQIILNNFKRDITIQNKIR